MVMKEFDLRLYSASNDPFSARVRFFLAEKKIEYSLVEVDHDNPSVEFLKINPDGETPVLVHQGRVLTESLVINEYLEEAFPASPLWPREPFAKARARIQIASVERMIPSLRTFFYAESESERSEAKSTIENEIHFLASEVGTKKFLGGELSLADIDAAPFLYFFKLLDLNAPKNISEWIDRVLERPSIAKDPWMEEFGQYVRKNKK